MKNNFQFLIYRSAEEDISVDAFIKDDTIWLTPKGMAKLFDCTTDNISFHLKNIYAEGELDETATAEESSVVQMEGSRTDIFAECSIDYDRDSPLTHDFYAMVQNKFHYAITGQTAAEIVYTKADHTKDHMGLTTWKNAPDGRVLKLDVSVAKNYLSEKQIRQLERAVSGYFDYIEDLIEREESGGEASLFPGTFARKTFQGDQRFGQAQQLVFGYRYGSESVISGTFCYRESAIYHLSGEYPDGGLSTEWLIESLCDECRQCPSFRS